jgi:subtilisin family serine protease
MHSRKSNFRFLGLFLIALVALMAVSSAMAQPAGPKGFTATPLSPGEQFSSTTAKDGRPNAIQPQKNGLVSVIVKLRADSLAAHTIKVDGTLGAQPNAKGDGRLDVTSSASKLYLSQVNAQINTFASAAQQAIPSARVTQKFDIVIGGVAMLVPADKVSTLSQLPGVAAVYPDSVLQLDTDRTPTFIGATKLWNDLGGQESAGENVIVGVLDTGIWPEHPSFSDPDPSGKPYPAPAPPISGTRQCEFSGGSNPGPAFSCNNKLIGGDRFMATYDAVIGLTPNEFTTARDDDGHGTHTSSTAAGNGHVAASIFGVPRGIISGIAPRAHVIMYKVCGESGCFSSDSAAAVQKAITDGVNVINFSISGGSNPYADAVELAFLDAYNANVFVSASAGNSGPTAETTDHRGPWVTTVGASTADRAFKDTINLTGDGGASLSIVGVSLTAGISTPTPVVSAAAAPYNDSFCANATADGAFTGKIVVCSRGAGIGRIQKGFNVKQRGAVGMILYNNAASVTDQETDNHYLPASHIQFADGQAVLAFLSSHTGVNATLTAGATSTQQGDVMASFSSRGGPAQPLGISKPDVTAPGVQILAGDTPQPASAATGAQPAGELFQAIAGTSMSSPHVAGSGALIKALHPTWTAGQIKSALMTTATRKNLVKEDGTTPVTPFDAGSGRINLKNAGDPGVTISATGADFITFQSQLYRANYPSLYIPSMPGAVTVQRTLQSVLTTSKNWHLSAKSPKDLKITVPSSVTVPAGGTGTFSIALDARDVPLGATRFALLLLESGDRTLYFPITIVRGQAVVTLDKTCAPATFAKNTNTTCTITIVNPLFAPSNINLTDNLPSKLQLQPGTVVGATPSGNGVVFTGSLPASASSSVAIAPGSSPAGGYLPLSAFGITPIPGVGDDTLTNFTVPAFDFAGQSYTSLGVSSNGYLVVGGGSGPDNTITNQNFPNATRPNNVLAAFWTDLNPAAAGAVRIGTLTDGSDTWIVVDWAGVREFSLPKLASFEIWIGVNSDADPAEDVSYAYGTIQGNGDGGFLSVGAENSTGNSGQNTYFNGTGTLPANGTQLRVTTTPGTVTSKVITFQAKGVSKGKWTNYATLTADTFFGTNISAFSGEVTP